MYSTGSDSHQLAISMSIHPCAFLEAALRCEERAVQNRSHREHAAHDGTCSDRGLYLSGASPGRGNMGQTYDVKKCAKD